MLTAVVMMGGLGLVVGVGLAIASKVFYVYVDPKIVAVDEALPGANCGGCGYPGCSSNAEAIVAGRSAANSCVAAGPDVAEAIAAILGVSIEATEPDIARPGCTYGVPAADTKYAYDGLNDCRAVALLSGGMKVCTIGCLGLGTCARVCPFNAITMGPNGLPIVHEGRCTGCGTCERACPKNIITLSSITRRILREYTTEECTTPCQRACPAGINISAYIGAIADGDNAKAVQIIKERNPFPTVIGRICPRPCENECRRHYVDEPVAINFLKRYAADWEKERGERYLPYKAPESGKKAAVIGGGVEGLSAAYFMARLGHSVTLFESGEQLGGLLRAAIARYRLPMDILDWDIQGVMDMGVSAKTGIALGSDITLNDLLMEGNQAVFLAVGGWDSRLLRTGGRGEPSPAPGCHLLIDIAKAGMEGYPELTLDGHVIIVGSPNLTPELIEKCKAAGAAKVTVLVSQGSPAPMKLAGADVLVDTGLTRLFGRGNLLSAAELTPLGNEDTQKVEVNHLVFASGRIPELIYAPIPTEPIEGEPEADTVLWEAFAPYKQPAQSHETGLLSAGDIFTDFSAAIKAIAAGRRAAASMHKALYGLPLDLPENVVTPQTMVQNVHKVFDVASKPRQIMPLTDPKQVLQDNELEKGFSPAMAKAESERCLQCGLICYLHESKTDGQHAATGN